MTEIGLIRHGITDWNQLEKMQGTSDIPLNDEGRDQARKLASRLHQDEKWDMIITSDLSRAKETGEIIGKKLDLPVSFVDKRIQEINLGEIEGTTEAERITRWGANWRELDLGLKQMKR
jgi:broad specificity phosphatase PhoE